MPTLPPPPEAADVAALRGRLDAVRDQVAGACSRAGRDPGEVRVLLATKTQPVEVVRAAVLAGARLLGENRVQELVAKAPELVDLAPELHVIGPLQSNKVNAALRWAACVQTVATVELAERLSARSAAVGRDLDVLVQVNVSGEPTKSGVAPERAAELAATVAGLARLRLRGFMTIGANADEERRVRAGFALLREVRDAVVASGEAGTADARELSMGMSGDMAWAVQEGATIVRPGSAVFGARTAR